MVDLAAWRADLVGSGGGGRRGALAFSFRAWLGRGPAMCEVVWVGVRGGEQLTWAAFGGRGGVGLGLPVCARGACAGHWGGWACRRGAGLPSVGVCGLSSVGGGEGCLADGCVAGMCWCSGGWGRPVSRGPGVRAMVGVCGSAGEKREGRGMGMDCAVGCAVSVYVSACSGALAWSVVDRAVWRRSLPSSAAAARILQTGLRIWWTFWSVVGRRYASSGLRPTRLRTLWVAWYPQVRECRSWGWGLAACPGPPRSVCWRWGWPKSRAWSPLMACGAGSSGSGRAWPVPGGRPPSLR